MQSRQVVVALIEPWYLFPKLLGIVGILHSVLKFIECEVGTCEIYTV